MIRLGCYELSINKLIVYLMFFCLLCVGLSPVNASETDTTLTKLYYETSAYVASPTNHELIRVSGSTTPPTGSVTVVIGSYTYYYMPASGENTTLLKLLSSYGTSALVETTDASKAVYNYDGVLYAYNSDKFMKSVYSLTEVSAPASNTIEKRVYNPSTGEYETKYYAITLNPSELNKGNTTFSLTSGGSDGYVAVDLTESSTKNVYYTHTKPAGWETVTVKKTEEVINKADGYVCADSGSAVHNEAGDTVSVENKVFDGSGLTVEHTFTLTNVSARSNYAYGGAVFNEGDMPVVTADFIGNYIFVIHENAQSKCRFFAYGGALANNNHIGTISGDFINNYVYGQNFYNTGGGALYNENIPGNLALIDSLSGNFIGNYVYSETQDPMGGAILNRGYSGTAKISQIDANFIGNHTLGTSSYGGAIAQLPRPAATSEIGSISGDFLGNYAAAVSKDSYGGAIYNKTEQNNTYSKIGNITGDFVGNYTVAQINAHGGAIYNMATKGNSSIKNIVGDFVSNHAYVYTGTNTAITVQGGAIFNSTKDNGRASIGDITGNFISNYVYGNSESSALALGGAIYNTATIGSADGGIINSSFYDNYAIAISRGSTSDAHGGAIYTSSDLTIIANDGYTSTFDGNYVTTSYGSISDTDNEAIYVDSPNATLTLRAEDDGKFIFHDKINGVDGYGLTMEGDGTGIVDMRNYIEGNPDLTVDNVTLVYNLAENGEMDFSPFNSVNVVNNGVFKTAIDMDIQNQTSDFFYAEENSSGVITIDNINMLSITSLSASDEIIIQVLRAPSDNLQLALSDAQAGREYYMGEIGPSVVVDIVTRDTDWSDAFYEHQYSAAQLYAITNIATTDTTNDSIGITVIRSGGTVVDIPLGDPLKLVNQSELAVRNFTTQDSTATYNVTDDLGVTKAGKLNIAGVKDENSVSTLNLNGKQGFVLSNNSELTFKDVKVTGSNTIADVSNVNAVVNVDGAEIDGNIDSTVAYTMNIKGDSKFNGTVSTANATMTEGNLSMSEDTFGNANLTVEGGTVNLQNDAVETYNIATLASSENVNYVIDFDADAQTSDVIQTANASTGTVTVDHINLINGSSFDDIPEDMTGRSYVVQILKTQNSDLQLALSENAQEELGDNRYKIGTTVHYSQDEILAVTPWEQDYYGKYTQDEIYYGTLGLATTDTYNDSIGITFTAPTEWGEKQYAGSLGDTLKLVNQANIDERTFITDDCTKTYTVTDDLGETRTGVVNVTGKQGTILVPDDPSNPDGPKHEEVSYSTVDFNEHSGFELTNDDTTVNFKDVKLIGADKVVYSDNETSTVNFDNVVMVDNTFGVETAGDVNVTGASEISSPVAVTSANSSINIDGTKSPVVNSNLTGVDGSQLNLANGNISFKENARVDSLDTTMSNTSVSLANEDTFNGVNLTIDGPSSLNIANNHIGTLDLGDLKLNSNLIMSADVDLANATMDRLAVDSVDPDSIGKVQVNKLNLMSPTTVKTLRIPFADENVASYVQYTGQNKIVYSKIYKYTTSYNNEDGYFTFVRGSSDDGKSFNPAVLVSKVSQLTGLYGAQVETFNIAFEHSDMYMQLPRDRRKAEAEKNRYAFASVPTAGMYSPIMTRATDRGYWLKPYAVFEKVSLKNGPKVSNMNYGTLFGYDTPIQRIGHGFDRVFTYYIGYNGSYQSYDTVDCTQNGGVLGFTTTLYKGNFFNATTVSAGASIGSASTKYGSENFVGMLAGVGNKLGYNWEFKQGRFIIQPSLFLGYSYIGTFDYKNAAGVKIKTSPLNNIEIAPGIKFIGNTKRGWQPYLGIQFVCNVFIQSESKANDVRLPDMYVDPYIQYGLGIQKIVHDRFTFFGQAMVRNGGRNGVSVTAGMRWILGR